VKVGGPHGDLQSSLEENGTNYQVHFTPQSDGVHSVSVTFQITATLEINVGAMVPDPIQCIAYGPGLEKGEQYKESEFTIESRNKLGQRVPVGGHSYKAKCTSPFGDEIPVDLVDNGDGSYSARYLPIVPGDHIVEVELFDQPIKDAPFTVPIDWNSETAHPHLSYAEGPGLEKGNKTRQNSPSHFTIHAVDKHGKHKKEGGDLFGVTIEDPLFDQIKAEVVDKGDGTYDVTYQAKEPGINKISMFLRNTVQPVFYEDIKDSPKDVEIILGTDPSKCTAEGPGLHDGIKDTDPAVFTIQARDRNGAPLSDGGEPFKVTVTDPNGEALPVEVVDNGDGTYGVVYNPDIPGPHTVDVQLDDTHIKDMPKQVNVRAGIWHGTTRIEIFTLHVRSRDKRNQNIEVGGQAPDTVISCNEKEIEAKMTDRNDGTYTYDFHPLPEPESVYNISSTIHNQPIKGTPATLKI